MKKELYVIFLLAAMSLTMIALYSLVAFYQYQVQMNERYTSTSNSERSIEKKIVGRDICKERYFRHLCEDDLDPYTYYY